MPLASSLQDPEVILFTADKCVFCGPVREQLTSLQRLYPFTIREINLTRDGGNGAILAEKYKIRSLPAVVVSGAQRLTGFLAQEELENALIRHLF
ncbi:MAG: hypothetical protein RBG13Loki_1712 [Promethearchaeota archaeon CR_4]|nr:MAG: hypothetical protein RBG13Loki_1712 [Candidatus Lokiarchaeota archaeon CR_4]